MAEQMTPDWQQACQRMADDHTRACWHAEHRRMTRWLADEVPRPESEKQFKPALQQLVAACQEYLQQEYFSDTTKAEHLAAALQRVQLVMLDPQQTQALEECGATLEAQVQQLVREHRPAMIRTAEHDAVQQLLAQEDDLLLDRLCRLSVVMHQWAPLNDHEHSRQVGKADLHAEIDRTLAAALCGVIDALAADATHRSAQQLADHIQAEIRQETAGHKSVGRIRLWRLAAGVAAWRDLLPGEDPHPHLVTICTEVLALCEHLGIGGRPAAVGDA